MDSHVAPVTVVEYSITALARLFRVRPRSIHQAIECGALQGSVRGTRRRFTKNEVDRFVRRNTYIGDQRAYPDE